MLRVSTDCILCTPEVTLVSKVSNLFPKWEGFAPSEVIPVPDIISILDVVLEPDIFSEYAIFTEPQRVSGVDILPVGYIIPDSEILESDLGTKIIESARLTIERTE
jgi:hypothetical protein